MIWTKGAKQVYKRFPSVIRSSRWPEVKRLADQGLAREAMDLALEIESKSAQFKAQNTMARAIRVNRVELFQRRKELLSKLFDIYQVAAEDIERQVARTANLGKMRGLMAYVRARMTLLRRDVVDLTTTAVWDSLKMGVKHTIDAVQPMIAKSQEEARQLTEERLHVGLDLNGNTSAGKEVPNYLHVAYKKLVQRSLAGLTPSERVWRDSKRAEIGIQSLIRTGMANGDGAPVVARRAKDFLKPDVYAGEDNPGTGVYRNPYKNAARLVRTEMNKAYTNAQAEWAKSRDWVKGMMVTLSPAHEVEDECDDHAGDIISPEEFSDLVPFHPHCMCFGTYVIKDEVLAETDNVEA